MTGGSTVARFTRKATGVLLALAGALFIAVGILFEQSAFRAATEVEGAGIVGLIGAVCFLGGLGCYRLGRRMRADSAQEVLARDPRPPVLYLRSFRDDRKAAERIKSPTIPLTPEVPINGLATEEEQLAMVADRVGPLVAIGQPGQLLPWTGANRFDASDARWQEAVRELIRASALVILRVGQTEGFWWEVMTCSREADPERLVFLLPKKVKFYEPFRQRASEYLPCRLPDFPQPGTWSAGPSGSIGGVLWFERDWTPRAAPVCGRWWSGLGHPIAIELADALRPVLRRAGATEYVIAPTARRCAAALLDTLLLGLLMATAYFVAGPLLPEDPEKKIPLLLGVLGIGFPAAYFVGFEVSPWQATPGKRLLRLEVRDRSGVSMSWYQVLFRWLVKWPSVISIWPLLISLILSLWGRRMIPDWLSRSMVLRREEAARPSHSPIPRPTLISDLTAAGGDPTRDQAGTLCRLVQRYCFLRNLTGTLALALPIGSGYVVYRETEHIDYTIGAALAGLMLAGAVIGALERAGARHMKKRIASSPLDPDERASLAGRLRAAKKEGSKDDLIDPLLAALTVT